jgi:gluconolactonase
MITDIKGVNGIAISPDQRSIYIAGNGKLLAYTISARGKLQQANGRAAARALATLDPKLGSPDGMKTEANGAILLACGADGILRYSAKGEFLSQTKFTGLSIVNLAFGGKDGRTLYLSDRVGSGMAGASQLQSVTWPRPGALFP